MAEPGQGQPGSSLCPQIETTEQVLVALRGTCGSQRDGAFPSCVAGVCLLCCRVKLSTWVETEKYPEKRVPAQEQP